MEPPVETNAFEVVYKLEVKNAKNTIYKRENGKKVDDIEGFALWYITHEPDEMDMRVGFGYRPDFNGLGVFVFKHEGQWRIQSIVNTGL